MAAEQAMNLGSIVAFGLLAAVAAGVEAKSKKKDPVYEWRLTDRPILAKHMDKVCKKYGGVPARVSTKKTLKSAMVVLSEFTGSVLVRSEKHKGDFKLVPGEDGKTRQAKAGKKDKLFALCQRRAPKAADESKKKKNKSKNKKSRGIFP